MKKVHKMKSFTWHGYLNGEVAYRIKTPLPVCKVHNKTYIYLKTWSWAKVTCEKCLSTRKNKL